MYFDTHANGVIHIATGTVYSCGNSGQPKRRCTKLWMICDSEGVLWLTTFPHISYQLQCVRGYLSIVLNRLNRTKNDPVRMDPVQSADLMDPVLVGERPYCCASFPLWCLGCRMGLGMRGIHAGYLCHYGDLVCVWASHLPSVEMCWTCTAIKKPAPKMDLLWNMTDFRGQIPLYLGKPPGCFFGEPMLSVFPGYLAVVMKHLGVSVNLASWGAPCKQINNADGYMIHQDDIVWFW